MAEPRTYSDDETAAILSRVAELSTTKPKDGLSIEELEHVAKEAGLDDTKVRQVAQEVARNDASAPQSIVTARRVHREMEVPGELDDEGRAAVLGVVREHLPTAQLSGTGRLLTFHVPRFQNGPLNVTVSGARGHTRIVVDLDRQSEPASNAVLAGSLGMIVTTLGTDGPLAGLLGDAAGVAAALVLGAGVAFGAWRLLERARRKVERDVDECFRSIIAVVTERVSVEAPLEPADAESALAAARVRQGLADALPDPSALRDVEVAAEVAVELKAK